SVSANSCCVDFFFQAEDGIRDRNVTGVQTCALPISTRFFKRRIIQPRQQLLFCMNIIDTKSIIIPKLNHVCHFSFSFFVFVYFFVCIFFSFYIYFIFFFLSSSRSISRSSSVPSLHFSLTSFVFTFASCFCFFL